MLTATLLVIFGLDRPFGWIAIEPTDIVEVEEVIGAELLNAQPPGDASGARRRKADVTSVATEGPLSQPLTTSKKWSGSSSHRICPLSSRDHQLGARDARGDASRSWPGRKHVLTTRRERASVWRRGESVDQANGTGRCAVPWRLDHDRASNSPNRYGPDGATIESVHIDQSTRAGRSHER